MAEFPRVFQVLGHLFVLRDDGSAETREFAPGIFLLLSSGRGIRRCERRQPTRSPQCTQVARAPQQCDGVDLLQPNHLADSHVLGQLQQSVEVFALVNTIPVDFDFESGFCDSISEEYERLGLIILT